VPELSARFSGEYKTILMMQITSKQLIQLKEKGISLEEINRQMRFFEAGMEYAKLVRPAVANDGILVFDGARKAKAIQYFKKNASQWSWQKFVPASGAATRMFKDLFGFIAENGNHLIGIIELPSPVILFASGLKDFAFYEELKQKMQTVYGDLPDEKTAEGLRKWVTMMLTSDGLQYGSLPKALIPFHGYPEEVRKAFEEHLVEWAALNPSRGNPLEIHFTLSPDHIEPFRAALQDRLPVYEQRFGNHFKITWSIQDPSTDTVAATENNTPFTDHEGNLLFRPGGHGALLFNLNRLDADLVFIKNIDNVCIESKELQNLEWKQLLGGVMLQVRDQAHEILQQIDSGISEMELKCAVEWIAQTFNHSFVETNDELIAAVRTFLDRPMRVCGMVKNTGEPGGGPFWVEKNGHVSLQIVESAQINMNNPDQKQIALQATHFNPVDLLCAITNHKGEKYDLNKFTDPDTSFISVKSYQGKVLKALEHPGLWNGAMAQWITLFVEVPLDTFNPVKTVNDLLKPEHTAAVGS